MVRSMFHSERDLALYHHAIHCALAALVRHATLNGRGWYHFIAGKVIAATEIAL